MAEPRIPLVLAAAALLAASGASCVVGGAPGGADSATLGAQELLVELPALPAAWAGLPELSMSLSWEDPKGEVQVSVAEPGSKISVTLARGRPQAIIATPYSAGRALLPCGALYPEALARQDSREDSLRLDWPGGYAASLAALLKARGVDPWGFDLYRLIDEALEKASDPWLVPPRDVARRLSTSTFKISLFKEPKRFAVTLPSPPEASAWAPESPFAQAASSVSLLPVGLWRFVDKEHVLLVSVDSEGQATSLLY